MPWNLFLMKILLKKEDCESREQCMGPTRPIFSCLKHASQKKKKKKKMQTQNQLYPNEYLIKKCLCFSVDIQDQK